MPYVCIRQSTNVHQYVEYSSCHPKSCKNGIPYSQGKRYRRIISNDTKFQENVLQLRDFFLERNYPESIVDEALGNVSSLTQDDVLQTSVKSGDKSVIPLITEYYPSLPNIGLIINKYWDLLQLSHQDSVSSVHAYWLLSVLRIYVITLYVRLLLIRTIIFLKHVVDVDVLIVKILLKLVFLQVIVPKSLSKCVIQQVAHLRMLFIWLNVNVVTCNTLVKQINKLPNVWIVIDLISIITMIKAMLLTLLCISIQIHIHLTISDLFLSILSIMRWIVFVRKLTGFINLTRFIQRAWIRNYCIILSRLAVIVCSYYFFSYMSYRNTVHQHWSNSFVLLVCL